MKRLKNNTEIIVLPPYTNTLFTLNIKCNAWGFGTHDQKFAVYMANAQ